jgi:hypothetical protein
LRLKRRHQCPLLGCGLSVGQKFGEEVDIQVVVVEMEVVVVVLIAAAGALPTQLLAKFLPETRGCARRLEDALLLDLHV